MKKLFLSFLLIFLPMLASAEPLEIGGFTKRTIHVATAGTLPDLISKEEKYLIEELTLTGELNGTDIHLIRDMAGVDMGQQTGEFFFANIATKGKLKFLDLSNAKIVEGGIAYYKELYLSGSDSWGDFTYTSNDVISEHMFWDCHALEELILPSSITKIESPLFYAHPKYSYAYDSPSRESKTTNIMNIKVVKIAEGNSKYDSRDNCNAIIETETNTLIAGGLNSTIPYSVTSIGDGAFQDCSGLTTITIPNSVTSINNKAFRDCCSLTSITIPNSVTSIGESAFSGCTSLNSFTIPNSITSINSYTFSDCRGLTSIAIPNSVTSIGDAAFQNCTGLVYTILPKNLLTIGARAFWGCENLTDVFSKAEKVPAAESTSFSNPKNIVLHIPNELFEAYKSTEPWSNFKGYSTFIFSDEQNQEKCSKPEINIADGKFVFTCETPGVNYCWSVSISSGTIYSNSNSWTGAVTLDQPVNLNVYATKYGYLPSEVTTYVLPSMVGDVDGNGVVNVADHVKLSEIILNK